MEGSRVGRERVRLLRRCSLVNARGGQWHVMSKRGLAFAMSLIREHAIDTLRKNGREEPADQDVAAAYQEDLLWHA